MGTVSSYAQNKFLNHVIDGNAWTMPTVYLALSTTDFTVAGTGGNEPGAGGYARVALASDFSPTATRIITNNGDIVFPQASGSWGTIAYWALFDALTGGNCLAFGSFSTGKAISAGQTVKVLSGQLSVSIPASNGMSTYLAAKFLNHIMGETAYASPGTMYVGMGTGAFSDAGSFANEVANAGAYARVGETDWPVVANTCQNNGAINFAVATANWGTVSHVFLADSATYGGGNMLIYGAISTPQNVTTDDQAIWAIGALDITIN